MPFLTTDLGQQQSAAGNAFIDIFSTDTPLTGSVSVGSASVSIELGKDIGECGLEGCEGGLWLSTDAARVYAVPRAISFKGSGVPADCPNYPINARLGVASKAARSRANSARRGVHSGPSQQQSAGKSTSPQTTAAQSAQVHTAAVNYQPDTVCVGPAYIVTGPLTVSSRDGKSKYSGGWLTYESFAFNRNDDPNQDSLLDCTVPYSSVQGLNLPVIDPLSYSITLHKHDGEAY